MPYDFETDKSYPKFRRNRKLVRALAAIGGYNPRVRYVGWQAEAVARHVQLEYYPNASLDGLQELLGVPE